MLHQVLLLLLPPQLPLLLHLLTPTNTQSPIMWSILRKWPAWPARGPNQQHPMHGSAICPPLLCHNGSQSHLQ
jgi:hypothetical protein